MEIKKKSQLIQGDVIKIELPYERVTQLNENKTNKSKFKKVELECIQAFTHHVLFKRVDDPRIKIDVQNSELWMAGIYKNSNLLRPFAVKGDAYE